MIIVRLLGGHSNQLFQYALGRQLAIKNKADLKLDLTWFDNIPAGDTQRHYEIDCYPLAASIASPEDMEAAAGRQRLMGRILRKPASGRLQRIDEGSLGYNEAAANAGDNTYLVGYWQNERYFKGIRDILIKELEPITPMTASNQRYLEKINSTESVSLHVRREDYVNNPAANSFHGLTPIEYYQTAYEHIKKDRGDIALYVFSNDLEWCKQNLKFDDITFVEGNQSGADDMRLMKHCKHNIMANSSFSWWGAWLNQNPAKIVITPKQWFANSKANAEMDNLPSEWVRL